LLIFPIDYRYPNLVNFAKNFQHCVIAKMEVSYFWWMEDDFYLGYIDEYPQAAEKRQY